MGNESCSCRKRRANEATEEFQVKKCNMDLPNNGGTPSPYENVQTNVNSPQTPVINPIIHEELQSVLSEILKTNSSNQMSFNFEDRQIVSARNTLKISNDKSDRRKTASSLFSNDSPELQNELHNSPEVHQIYESIFREFLIDNYPFTKDIVNEMAKRNLLLSDDADAILEYSNDHDKALNFMEKFVFSEANVCRLATFLYVLISEKFAHLFLTGKTEQHFLSIVDTIYYIVNIVSLIQECTAIQTKSSLNFKYFSSLVDIRFFEKQRNYITSIDVTRNDIFLTKVNLSNITLPSRFWRDFACINQNFSCCYKVILSSCCIRSEDVYHVVQGFLTFGNLEILDVSSNPIGDDGLKHICSLFCGKNKLLKLNIACCSVTEVSVEYLLDLFEQSDRNIILTDLNLSYNDLFNLSEKSLRILTKIPLRHLQIHGTNIKCHRFFYESLKLNYTIIGLDIGANKLASSDVAFLASGLAYNMSIRCISLAMMGLTKLDCLTLNNTLLMNKAIVSLDLSDNIVGDDGSKILSDILTMKKTLKELFMKRCGISPAGILYLIRRASESSCNLKILDLCYNHSPRLSLALDIREIRTKIQNLLHDMSLVKDIRILLWGTIDLSIYEHHYNELY